MNNVDVLCVGHASYDLVFSIPAHPEQDEKIFADHLLGCGGGPAANAAVTVARLGYRSAFAGYLGRDLYGDTHFKELQENQVDTGLIVRGPSPTPLSVILVKPDGQRALINYKGDTKPLPEQAIDLSTMQTKCILFDGHEPHISVPLAELARQKGVPTVLDAGSLHAGTRALMNKVSYLVCSEKFARQYAGESKKALTMLSGHAENVVITLGERGLIWKRKSRQGQLPGPPVEPVDTTGAGDAFHGAFAAAVAAEMEWLDLLRFSSAAGAFCCTRTGARPGLPCRSDLPAILDSF